MLVKVDQQTKKSMEQDGSYLKFLRSTGGMGISLIVLGACFGGFIVVIGIAMGLIMEMPSLIAGFVGVGIAVAAVFGIPGFMVRKKRVDGYLDYFAKKSGYTVSELNELDAEFDQKEAVLFTPFNKLNKQAKLFASVFTERWANLPGIGIARARDIAAIWWEDEPYYKGVKRGKTCFVLSRDGKVFFAGVEENHVQEITSELVKRNPKVITVRKFHYNGQNYDALDQPEEVAALYRSASEGNG